MEKKIMLNEAFNIKNAELTAKDGHKYKIAYVDPKTSENTYAQKAIFSKYNAHYMNNMKAWVWYLGQNPESVYHNYIEPCLDELTKVEDNGAGTRVGQVTQIIDQLISEINGGGVASMNIPTVRNVTDALSQFKQELINCTSSEEFKKRMEPIIKAQQALGHQYSFANTLLIWIQDPEATMVKSATGWAKMNRIVVDKTSKPIMMWRPDKEKLTPEQRKLITSQFLQSYGVSSVKELNPGQKEELRIQLNGGQLKQNDDGRSKFKPYFGYDVRFTQQMEGKEDLVGDSSGKKDIKWFDDSKEENEHLSACIQAAIEVIQDAGITVEYETQEQMGGALGMSCSNGVIKLLANAEPTPSFLSTCCHEFSHSLLHQSYVKKSKGTNSEWAQFFVGTEKGRGFVEQQAEISSYIVCRYLGYDTLESAANYAGCWGMDDKSTFKTFDSVAQVASFIIRKIGEKLNQSDNNQETNTEEND